MRGLQRRLAFACIGIASSIVLLACFILIRETHYHFMMFQQMLPQNQEETNDLRTHFEQALIQSIAWTTAGAIFLAIAVSILIAKRITAPLMRMENVAQKMKNGDLQSRVEVSGDDELADLGLALNQLAEQLQTQEELRKSMTSDIAHELRTPLATLKSHLEAILDGVWEPTHERIQSCYEENERLIHLVSDLEELNQVESPGFTMNPAVENLVEIARHVVNSTQASYLKKGVGLSFDHPNEPIMVTVDRIRIAQVLVNLLSNSLKYTPSGGEVTLRLENKDEIVMLTLSDTGIGIPMEELPFVFERFYRTEKSRSRMTGGSGIGLTIVKRLVEAHGGTISIHSQEGIGSTFTIELPKSRP